MSAHKKWILRKEKEENNTILFMCCREGIEEDAMEQINIELDEIEKENGYKDKLGIEYSRLCERYWEDYICNSEKNLLDLLKRKYNIEKPNEESYLLRELRINSSKKQYILRWDYEIFKYTDIIVRIHLFDLADKNGSDFKKYFDNELEELKISIKNFWISELKSAKQPSSCYWLEDTQSQYLSVKSYTLINDLENKLRNFINEVMLYRQGIDWTKILEDSSVVDKHKARSLKYKKTMNCFSNIDDFLLSLDSDDLEKIMSYERKHVRIEHRDKNLAQLLDKAIQGKDVYQYFSNVRKFLDEINKKYIITEEYIWNEFFSELFDYKDGFLENLNPQKHSKFQSKFREDWKLLCEYRNHIAHNKFIHRDFYTKLKALVKSLQNEIKEAEIEFRLKQEIDSRSELSDYSTFTDKKQRERVIYYELKYFTKSILDRLSSCETVAVKVKEGFRFYEYSLNSNSREQEEEELAIFINCLKNNEHPMKFIEIKSNMDVHKEVALLIKKNKGKLTSYLVYVMINSNFIEKISIGHSGYSFYCDGISEDDMFLGGNWREFSNKIYDLLTNMFLEDRDIEIIRKDPDSVIYFPIYEESNNFLLTLKDLMEEN